MCPARTVSPDLQNALEAFPEDAALVLRLFLAESGFRSVCEDYRLALEGVIAFASMKGPEPRVEVEDYRRLVGELKAEMGKAIRAARGTIPPASSG